MFVNNSWKSYLYREAKIYTLESIICLYKSIWHFHLPDLWCKQNGHSRFKFSVFLEKLPLIEEGILHLITFKAAVLHFLSVPVAASGLLLKDFIPLFITRPIKCQWEESLERCVTVVTKSFSHPRKSLFLGCSTGFKISRNHTSWSKDVWRAWRTCYHFQSILGNARKDSGVFFQNNKLWTVWGKAVEIIRFDSPAIDRTMTFYSTAIFPTSKKKNAFFMRKSNRPCLAGKHSS